MATSMTVRAWRLPGAFGAGLTTSNDEAACVAGQSVAPGACGSIQAPEFRSLSVRLHD